VALLRFADALEEMAGGFLARLERPAPMQGEADKSRPRDRSARDIVEREVAAFTQASRAGWPRASMGLLSLRCSCACSGVHPHRTCIRKCLESPQRDRVCSLLARQASHDALLEVVAAAWSDVEAGLNSNLPSAWLSGSSTTITTLEQVGQSPVRTNVAAAKGWTSVAHISPWHHHPTDP
jgi:hypothetical protein